MKTNIINVEHLSTGMISLAQLLMVTQS